MHIEEFTIGQLGEFITSQRFNQQNVLPITVHRAISQTKNPRAHPEDVVLIVAFDETDQIVAYVGALPDLINSNCRVVWNSCWYADTTIHKTIALPLLIAFIKKWHGRILMQDLTEHTRKIIKKLPYFSFIRQMDGTRIFLRFYFSDILCNKYPFLEKCRFILEFMDSVFNSFISVCLFFRKFSHPLPHDIRIEEVNQIDIQTQRFIEENNSNELCRRGKPEFDWICENPWIIRKTIENADLLDRYQFSSLAESFSYRKLKIMRGPDLISFYILKERNKHFEVPYMYCINEDLANSIKVVTQYLIEQKARSFTYFNSRLGQFIFNQGIPVIYKKKLQRELVVSKELVTSISHSAEIQDGDGDTIFT